MNCQSVYIVPVGYKLKLYLKYFRMVYDASFWPSESGLSALTHCQWDMNDLICAGEQDESVCKTYITQIKDLRLRLEGCESRMVSRLRQPVDKEPLKACAQRTTEHKVCYTWCYFKHGSKKKKSIFQIYVAVWENPSDVPDVLAEIVVSQLINV